MAEKKVARVTLNGETLMDVTQDSVSPEVLAENETAHNHAGEPIVGSAQIVDGTYYNTSDPASTDLADNDYIPFNDVSDAQVPKKKTLFSTIINKLKSVFLTKQVGNSNNELFYDNYLLGFKDNDVDATKADNNVSAITFPSTFRIVDKNSNVLGVAECVVNPNGNIGLKFYAKNYDTEGVNVAQKGMEFRIAKNGVMEYVINDPYKFQAAIGSGYCEGTVSGTAITATIPGFVLVKGGIIVLKMSAAMPIGATLNINNTGAKDVYWENSTAIRAYDMPRLGNMTWILTYDGARYLIVGVSKSTIIGAQNYVADTSGNIVLNAFYDSNAFQLKHRIEPNDLVWNRFKNGAWHGDVKLVDYEDLLDCSQVVSGGILASHKIVSTDDLNDYTASGTYQYAYSNDGLPANCPLPLNRSFKLIVDRYNNDSKSEICQRITMVNTSSTEHWLDWYRFRMWNQSTWGDWMQVANVADSAQLNKINAIDITSGNLNDYKTPGTYQFGQSSYSNITNVPPINDSYMIWVMNTNGDTSYYRQIAFARANSAFIYSRIYNNGNWTPWALIYSEVNFGISISSNANLNDYTTPGVYKIATNNEAATMSNIPVKVAGKLIVMEVAGGTYRVQQYIPYNIAYTNNHGLMYQRTWNNDSSANTWSDWIKYADYRDLNQSVAHTGKNLLTSKHPAYGYIDNGGAHVTNGITFTYNTDGSITANGTATADAYLNLIPTSYGYMLPKGSYVLTGCPSGGSDSKYRIGLNLFTISGTALNKFDYGSGNLFTLTEDCNQGTTGNYYICVKSGVTVSNIVFKPMIRHAYTDATYEKYIPNGQDVKGVVYVGTCTTAADQQVKVVNVDSDFRLKKGVRIAVKFSNTNTYNSTTSAPCQLNVNSTGAKSIYYNTASSSGWNTGTFSKIYGIANRYIYYFFNGTDWVWDGCGVDDNTTYSLITADQISAGTDTASRVVRADYLKSGIKAVMNESGSVFLAKLRLKEIDIPDNSGYSKYLLLHDITEWYNSTTTGQKTQGFNGWIISSRQNGDMLNYTCEIKALVSYAKVTSPGNGGRGLGRLLLESNHQDHRCVILKDPNNKYYLAVRCSGSGRQAVLFGRWIHDNDRNTNWTGFVGTWVNCTDSSGTLPSGYSIAIDGRGNSSPVKNITRSGNTFTATRQDDTTFTFDQNSNFLRNDASSILTASGAPYLNIKSTTADMTQSNNGVDSNIYPAYIITDKNGKDMSRFECVVRNNGSVSTYVQVRNLKSDSTNPNGGLTITMDKNGVITYGMSSPSNFNAALGEGYGTCSTAADQQIKVVACANFVLCVGAVIHVRFTNTNTYNSTTSAPVKLNVNSTGEKVIYYNNNPGTSSNTGTNTRIYGEAGRTFTYMYDGTYWVWLGCGYEADTVDPRVLGFGYATCDTTASTAAKVATLSSYALRIGGYVSVYFTYDVPANATLNINSKGAKTMRYKGANLTAGKIRGGDIATFVYDGTYYVLVGIDSSVPDINTIIAMSDCDWSATLKSKCTMATSGGVWSARMINNNFLYVSVEVGYTNAVAATIPSYGQTTTEVFFRIKNKFKECLNISEVMVDLNGVIYPAFAGIYTVDNVSCVTVALRKPASLVAGSGNIRFTFILPCKRI